MQFFLFTPHNLCLYKGSQFPVRPSVVLITAKTIDEGTSLVEIPCYAEGVPSPFVKWDTVDVSGKHIHILVNNIKVILTYLNCFRNS